jgi:hypothetical protein
VKYKTLTFAQKKILKRDFKNVEKSKARDFLDFKLNKNLWLIKLFLTNVNIYIISVL